MTPKTFATNIDPRLLDDVRRRVQDPLWYIGFDIEKYDDETLFGIFEILLREGSVTLGRKDQGLYEWDGERAPVNRFVIHHSTYADGIALDALNALELIRVYLPAYQNPAPDDAPRIKGKPVYSGHFDNAGKQVFYPYHWLISPDGSSKRLLADKQIGWHAGDWTANCDSIGICFDTDLTHAEPNQAMITAAADILRSYQGTIPTDNHTVVGHHAIVDSTECPGREFVNGLNWRTKLLDAVNE